MDNIHQMSSFFITIFLALGTHQCLKRYDPVDMRIAAPIVVLMPAISMSYLAITEMLTGVSMAYLLVLFYATLLASVVGYRLSPYHPLAAYPGPTMMKVTKLWTVWIAYTGKTNLYLKSIHDTYGPVVRIGPNELSTIEKELLPSILGSRGMPKGPMWDGRRFSQTDAQKDYDNIIDLRDPAIHLQLRKPWNKAFSAEPLKDYELLLFPRIGQIISHLRTACEGNQDGVGRVNIAKWISCFTFDFIGDVAFGGCFQLMREGDKDGCFHNMEVAMFLPSLTQHVPWLSKILRYFPAVNGGMTRFISFAMEKAIARYTMQMKKKDLFYYMSEASGSTDTELPLIISNALLAMVAGSDTVAFTVSSVMYLLLSHPAAYHRLRLEVDETFEKYDIPNMDTEVSEEEFSMQARYGEILSSMSYLTAVMNEAMRLFPSVATGLQRAPLKGSGGKMLQNGSLNIFLPEGNAITVPSYVLHRDARYFSPSPDAFMPERWLDAEKNPDCSSKFMTSRDAFIPFSLGQQNCVGRPLALMEMRYLITVLMRNFDIEFDHAVYDAKQWEANLEDRYTCQPKGALPVTIRRRTHT